MFQIRIMEEISVNGFDLSTMCRLCLSRSDATLDVFAFSTRLMSQVADVIMKCAPVQITRCDDMPNLICNSCNTQLEKSHQFQKQIVQSDQTLRRYLQQLRTSNKQIKGECSNQGPSDDSFTNKDIKTKSESLELRDVSDNVNLKEEVPSNDNSAYAISEKIFIKTEIKEEPIDYEPFISIECTDNLKETLPREGGSKASCEIKEEPIDDNSLILMECTDILIDTLSKGDDRTAIEEQSDNILGLPNADLTGQFDNREYGNENTTGSYKKPEESNKHKYKCDLCNKDFAFLSKFNIHNRRHTGERPYQCDVCNKTFTVIDNLRRHRLVHTGEKPYQCDVCNKRFSRLNTWRAHQRVHTGDKPYQCDFCNQCFKESSNLITHQLKHTSERSYQCGVCDKYFCETGALIRHQRVHTGEKPYQCDVCNKQFTQSGSLSSHKRTHSSVV